MVKAMAGNFLMSFVLPLEQISRVYLLTEVLMECDIRLITENKNDSMYSY